MKKKDHLLEKLTFNLMISGNLVKLWLDDINIKTHTVIMNATKLSSWSWQKLYSNRKTGLGYKK